MLDSDIDVCFLYNVLDEKLYQLMCINLLFCSRYVIDTKTHTHTHTTSFHVIQLGYRLYLLVLLFPVDGKMKVLTRTNTSNFIFLTV